jgi:hypothetical protein
MERDASTHAFMFSEKLLLRYFATINENRICTICELYALFTLLVIPLISTGSFYHQNFFRNHREKSTA